MKTKQSKALIQLCQSCELPDKESIIEPAKRIYTYKLDFEKPLQRGQLLEAVILNRIISKNQKITLHHVRGEYRTYGKERYYKVHTGNLHSGMLYSMFYDTELDFDSIDFRYRHSRHFKAKYRCLPKISIDYCFVDVILDDTILDIKTDVNTKCYTKYLRQLFIQAVMFEAFLRAKVEFYNSNPAFSELSKEVSMICSPVTNLALYFWRSNHLFKHPISDISELEVFDQIVNIYAGTVGFERREARSIIRQNLFKDEDSSIEFYL